MRSATNTDSAAFPGGNAWDHVNWPIVYRRVRGLQIRIAKATRDQDWRRVKALQRFLVLSTVAQYGQMTILRLGRLARMSPALLVIGPV